MNFFLSRGFILAAMLFAPLALAQGAWPAKPVTIIVPFAAGGVADLLPRVVGAKLAEKWNLTFDTYKDLTPVTELAQSPNVLVVHPSVPVKTFKELIAYAEANPGKLNFASPGAGSGAHLAGELLKADAGIDMVHVPYKGLAPAVNDLLGGNTQLMFAGISTVIQYVKSGKLVALAIASPARSPELPDVPTIAESGLSGFDGTSWFGLFAPAGTAPEVIARIHADVKKVFGDAAFRERFLRPNVLEPRVTSPEEFAAAISRGAEKWGAIIRGARLKAN